MPKVLIVDDEKGTAGSRANYLKLEGWTAIPVFSGEEALRTIDSSFDAVLLDLVMKPGIDGEEVLRAIRANPELSGVCVVIVTAYGEMTSAIRCLRQGAFQYLHR